MDGPLGLQLLGQKISNSGEICKILQDQIDSSSVIPYKLFTSSSAAQTLGSCSLKLNTHASQVRDIPIYVAVISFFVKTLSL